jgi:hypothetical protein
VHSGIARRIRGFEQANDVRILGNPDVPLYVSNHGLSLDDKTDWALLKAAMASQPPALVIVDTLATNMTGDENSTQDINAFYEGLRQAVTVPYGAACIFISHIGHKENERPKGARQILGNADSSTELAAPEPDLVMLQSRKMKDSRAPKPFALAIREVTIDTDEDGDPITTMVIDRRNDPVSGLTDEQEAVFRYLQEHPGAALRAIETDLEMKANPDGKKAGRICQALGRLGYLKKDEEGWIVDLPDLSLIGQEAD